MSVLLQMAEIADSWVTLTLIAKTGTLASPKAIWKEQPSGAPASNMKRAETDSKFNSVSAFHPS
jgi:hypothetical protein